MSSDKRTLPNILITGTPGTGKSTLAEKLSKQLKFKWINVSELAKEKNYLSEIENDGCGILDEDKVVDELEETVGSTVGGVIVEYHGCDFFPERWFDMVIVLRTSTEQLYDRLSARGYAEKKLRDNVDCEIFQVLAEEARESYKADIIHELQSDTKIHLKDNLKTLKSMVKKWKEENS
ncbi:hypothetical protein AAG570_001813 [Ranatra chinensis]|uniref:Adenylate kinase isoenzyme 6 homolog n=1 Tax=Ranatra chinensis TaxID=642074 RepID=A0ABD0YW50_9HEMI